MDELEKLSGLNGAMKGINSVNDKINAMFETQEKLKKFANPFSVNENLLGISSQLKAINDLTDKFKSPFEDILKPKNGIYIGDNTLSQFLNNGLTVSNSINMGGTLNQIVNKDLRVSNSDLLQSVNKVSLFYNMDGLKPLKSILQGIDTLKPYTASFNGLNEMKPLFGISQIVNEKIGLYNHQIKLSENISTSLIGAFKIDNPFSDIFNSNNFVNHKALNSFDIHSASTFVQVLQGFNNENNDLKEAFQNAEKLLSENTLLNDEIVSFQATAIALNSKGSITSKDGVPYKIYEIKDLLEWFLNKILLKKLNLSVPIAYVIIYSLITVLLIMGFFYTLIVKENSSKIYSTLMNSEEKYIPKQIDTIVKYIKPSNEISDFTVKLTPLYLRSSEKSKLIARFKVNSTVLIIKIKNKWCLVEGKTDVEKKSSNKKTVLVNKTIRGWVKKENLDMFQ